jgi:hypothetical protein
MTTVEKVRCAVFAGKVFVAEASMRLRPTAIGVLLALLPCAGCQYFRVRDVATGKEYITNNWSMGQSGFSGATQFVDLKTGKTVVLQSYETERIPTDVAQAEIKTGKN